MSRHGSRGSSGSRCEPCVKKAYRGHRDARDAKYCPKHQCPVTGPSGIVCTKHKKGNDERCDIHSTCEFRGCKRPRLADETAIPHSFCTDHKCVVTGCVEGKVYNPNENVHGDICASHALMKCVSPACFNWKADGNFCKLHSCIIDGCGEKIVQDRPFCPDHNKCTFTQCTAERLQRGDRFEDVCHEHYIPPCRLSPACQNKAQKHSTYCSVHSCRYQGCSAEARPAKRRPYCDEHRCRSEGCQALSNLSEVNGDLKINTFCTYHECRAPDCMSHTAPENPGAYCASHCCTNPTCDRARDGDPRIGTLCFPHHEEKIAEKAREKALEDIAAQLHLDEEYAAQTTEEEKRRKPQREPRPYNHAWWQEYPPNSYVDEEYDEGYRSNRNSDSHYQPHQGHSERNGGRGW